MKKILLTGSNGLLGQKIVSVLCDQKNIRLIATSKGANQSREKTSDAYISLDVTDRTAVEEALIHILPDTVIHTAAMTQVDDCQKDEKGCWKLNVEAVAHLIKACKKSKSHLIQLSTDFVFDGKNGPYQEEDLPNPQSIYAKSKLASEELLQKSSIPWTIIRTILVYGTTATLKRSNIVHWAVNSFKEGKKVRAIKDQFRSPTLAEDLAAACTAAALKDKTGIYHVSGKELMSIYDFVKVIAEVFGFDSSAIEAISTKELNQAAPRPAKTGFVLKKAMKDLGYAPHTVRAGLTLVKQQLGL